MKKILLTTALLSLGLFAAGNNQYSHQNQQGAFDQAKGQGEMKQHQYRKGEGSSDGKKYEYQYRQHNGKGPQGGQGGGGMHRGGKR